MQEHQSSGPYIGVDVAKDELVICTHGHSSLVSIPNRAGCITRWLKTLEAGSCVAMESTGRYHALLATLAWQAGLSVYVLNARDVSFYAKALGSRAKTDGVDARVIARYLTEHRERLHPWSGAHPQLERLQALLSRRTQLAVERSAAVQVLGEGLGELPEAGALLAAFDTLLQRLEQEIKVLIEADPQRARRYECLQSIPGIGPATGSDARSVVQPDRLCQRRCGGRVQRLGSSGAGFGHQAWQAALEQARPRAVEAQRLSGRLRCEPQQCAQGALPSATGQRLDHDRVVRDPG